MCIIISNLLLIFQRSDEIASRTTAEMDTELLDKFVPVFILSQKKVIKLKKLEILSSRGVTIHSCSECDYQTERKGDSTRHLRTHSGVKPFECEQCDHKFSVKGNLTTHMLTHDQALKKLKCDTCNYKCNTNQKLTRHRLTHTVERPYQCDQCNVTSPVFRKPIW